MSVTAVLTAPWLIQEEMLAKMIDIYDMHLRGEKLDLQAIQATLGRPLQNEPKPYQVVNGVGVLEINGVLAKRMDMFTEISGGASTQRLQGELAAALADPDVHSILLNIDSPGGEVDGTQALAQDVFAARTKKPVMALGDGVMASGAYWIASAAERVFITSDTTAVGSIGVLMAHTDISRAQEARGVKVTEITAGKYKTATSRNAPLSRDGKEKMQEMVDHIYGVFLQSVALNRGTTAERVHADMGDGRIFMGQKAIAAGLVDGFSTFGDAIRKLAAEHQQAQQSNPRGAGYAPKFKHEDRNMPETKETQNTAPLTDQQLAEQIANALATGEARGRALGVADETARIREIYELGANTVGCDALVRELMFDGKTSAPEAAVKILQQQRGQRDTRNKELHADAPKPLAPAGEPRAANSTEPDPKLIADKARELVATRKKEGVTISLTEAVGRVREQMGLPITTRPPAAA